MQRSKAKSKSKYACPTWADMGLSVRIQKPQGPQLSTSQRNHLRRPHNTGGDYTVVLCARWPQTKRVWGSVVVAANEKRSWLPVGPGVLTHGQVGQPKAPTEPKSPTIGVPSWVMHHRTSGHELAYQTTTTVVPCHCGCKRRHDACCACIPLSHFSRMMSQPLRLVMAPSPMQHYALWL